MNDFFQLSITREVLERLVAAGTIVLMGYVGIRLLIRLLHLSTEPEKKDFFRPSAAVLAQIAVLAVLTRIAVMLAAYLFYRIQGGTLSFLSSHRMLWEHWDTRQYLWIAENGYTAVGDDRLRLVFFPLYPYLVGVFARLFHIDPYLAGTGLSFATVPLSAIFLYCFAGERLGEENAFLAVCYFLFNPLSVFLTAVYAEGLFLCLTLGCLATFRRHPFLSCVLGMAGSFTRMPGVIVAGFILIEALTQWSRGKLQLRDALSALLRMGIVFCGLFAYWLVNYVVTGDPFAYMTYQKENWFQEPGWFFETASRTLRYLFLTEGASDQWWTFGAQLAAILYAMVLLAVSERGTSYDVVAYSFVYLMVVFSPTWLLSGPRYLFGMATLPLLQTNAFRKKGIHIFLLLVSAGLLLLFTYGYCIVGEVL